MESWLVGWLRVAESVGGFGSWLPSLSLGGLLNKQESFNGLAERNAAAGRRRIKSFLSFCTETV